jgi:hypothetical protein
VGDRVDCALATIGARATARERERESLNGRRIIGEGGEGVVDGE